MQTDVYRRRNLERSEFAGNGVNLTQVKKITIGLGNKTDSAGQTDTDTLYIDYIRQYQPRCLNPDNLNLRRDVNGDCKINLYDPAIMANGWLNNRLALIP